MVIVYILFSSYIGLRVSLSTKMLATWGGSGLMNLNLFNHLHAFLEQLQAQVLQVRPISAQLHGQQG